MRGDFIQAGLFLLSFFVCNTQKLCSRTVGCVDTLFLEEVMRFDAITPWTGECRLAPFKHKCVRVCVFWCLSVSNTGRYCYCTLIFRFSFGWVGWNIEAGNLNYQKFYWHKSQSTLTWTFMF